jgi:hypothetical protein
MNLKITPSVCIRPDQFKKEKQDVPNHLTSQYSESNYIQLDLIPPDTIVVIIRLSLIINIIANLPESSRTSRAIGIVVLVEPRTDAPSLAPKTAHLHTLTAPAWFAVEYGERGPADVAGGGLSDGTSETGVCIWIP